MTPRKIKERADPPVQRRNRVDRTLAQTLACGVGGRLIQVWHRVAGDLPGGLLIASAALVAIWHSVLFFSGPQLAISHDELNYLQESLRLLSERRLNSFNHGPLFYEILAVLHAILYFGLRLVGVVDSPISYLVFFLENLTWYLRSGRAIVGIMSIGLLVQVYRLGNLFGSRWIGALAAALLSVNLTFVTFATVCKEDVLYWLLFLGAAVETWLAVTSSSPRLHAVLSGLALGAAAATKLFALAGAFFWILPLVVRGSESPGLPRKLKMSTLMASATLAAFLIMNPFLITDTQTVIESQRVLSEQLAQYGLQGSVTAWAYLTIHLPNLIGVPMLLLGVGGLIWHVNRNPLGPWLLGVPAFAQLAFLGSRSGHSMAYYVFPAAVYLLVLGVSTLVALAAWHPWRGKSRALVALSTLTIALSGPYGLGALKHLLVLSAPDVRLEVRRILEQAAEPGSTVLLCGAAGRENFWGPPITPTFVPDGPGIFSTAKRIYLERLVSPRFDVRLTNGLPEMGSPLLAEADWVVIPGFSASPLELLDVPEPRNWPEEFEVVAEVRALPNHSYLFPFPTAADYKNLREVGFRDLLCRGALGWNFVILRRSPGTEAG